MSLLSIINQDLNYCGTKNPFRKIFVFFFNVSFRLILNYRIGHYMAKRRNIIFNIILLYFKKKQLTKYGCDISYECTIGNNISFPHPIGIVIGNKSIIGDNVMIWQNVVLGSKGGIIKSYPTVESNVKIYSSAQILGNIKIGAASKIGAMSLVINDVPPNSVAVGIPAKVINKN